MYMHISLINTCVQAFFYNIVWPRECGTTFYSVGAIDGDGGGGGREEEEERGGGGAKQCLLQQLSEIAMNLPRQLAWMAQQLVTGIVGLLQPETFNLRCCVSWPHWVIPLALHPLRKRET